MDYNTNNLNSETIKNKMKNIKVDFGKCIFSDPGEDLQEILNIFNIPLYHPPDCPMKDHTILNTLEKKVKLASVGIVVDKEGKVLLTRRHKKMRTFPMSWVFPGGQLDENESFLDAMIREVIEETGIKISKKEDAFLYNDIINVIINPLMFYESCFPVDGRLTSHSLIFFYSIEIDEIEKNINLKIQTEEVDAYCWLDKDILKKILYQDYKHDFTGMIISDDKFEILNMNENNFLNKITGEYIPYGHYLAINNMK